MHEEVVFVCDSQKWDDLHATQLTFTYSKSTTEALEKGVKYVQSFLATRLQLKQWFSMSLNFEERKIDSLRVKPFPLTYDPNECKCKVNMHLFYVGFF